MSAAAPLLLPRRSLSVCLACRRNLLRQFSTTRARPFAFQSYPLVQPSAPQQARNTTVPDTSISQPIDAAPLPRVHETRPPAGQVSIPEKAAQQSKKEFVPAEEQKDTTAATTAAASSTTTAAATPAAKPQQRKPRLRTPRKAAMKLTPEAVEHLRDLLDQPEPKLIRVGVKNRGCSGLAYHLEYVDAPGKFDETVEQDGVRVLIDSKALFSIIGSEMDWVEDKLQQKFVFRNPNISESTHCALCLP